MKAFKVSFRVDLKEITKNPVMFVLKWCLWYLGSNIACAMPTLVFFRGLFIFSDEQPLTFSDESPPHPHPQVIAASDVGLEQTWSDIPFSYIRQLLLEEKEGLLGDIAFLQVQ